MMMLKGKKLTRRTIMAAPNFASLGLGLAAYTELCDTYGAAVAKEVAQIAARKPLLPIRLDYLQTECAGVTFRIYGVIHGLLGGESAAYRDFVRQSLAAEKCILYEKMLGRFYGGRGARETPDFMVLGALGQLALSWRLTLLWPLFLWQTLICLYQELFTRRVADKPPGEAADFSDGINYHALEPELRRGLCGALPTRLQVEYEQAAWRGWRRFFDEELLFAVVPRSLYIAAFAQEYARLQGWREVAIVVGDRHLTETLHFLQEATPLLALKRLAARHAQVLARGYWRYYWFFGRYLLVLCAGAFLGLLPWLLAISGVIFWWRS